MADTLTDREREELVAALRTEALTNTQLFMAADEIDALAAECVRLTNEVESWKHTAEVAQDESALTDLLAAEQETRAEAEGRCVQLTEQLADAREEIVNLVGTIAAVQREREKLQSILDEQGEAFL